MRIWYQTSSPYRHDSTYDEYGKILKELCKRASRPDTEVHIAGVSAFMPEVAKYKSIYYYHKSQIFNNMFKAEKEGYDAFIIGSAFDPGLVEGREMLDIPVVGVSETSYYMAAMLGELFATVTIGAHYAETYRQQIVQCGLSTRHLPGPYVFTLSEEELLKGTRIPDPVIKKFKTTAEIAINDSASVIIPSPVLLSSIAYKAGLTNMNGIPVLNTVGLAVKYAEMLVDLKRIGIEISRKLQVYGTPGKTLLKEVFKKYAPVFKIEY